MTHQNLKVLPSLLIFPISTPPTSSLLVPLPSGQTYFMLKPSTATSFTSSGGKKHLYDAEGRSLVDLDKKMVSMHGTWLLTRSADGSRIAEVKPSKKSEYMCCAVLCSSASPPPGPPRVFDLLRSSDSPARRVSAVPQLGASQGGTHRGASFVLLVAAPIFCTVGGLLPHPAHH